MELVKEAKSVAKFDNNIVDNNAIKFEKKLSINQQKILYYLLIQEKKGASLQGTTWNELQKILGIRNSTLRERKEFIEDIRSVSVNMCIDKENMEYHYIFPSIGLRYNKLFYTINAEVIELFDEPEIKYYLMNFEYFRNFKHEHSLKLYQLLNKQLGANDKSTHDFTYEIEELKLYLGIENTKAYIDFSNFRRRILEPSFTEISEYSDIKIEGKYNPRTKKHQLFSKVIRKEQIFIGGISRKNTVQEYVQEQFDNAILAKEESKTKINKESKVTNMVHDIEESNEVSKGVYGEFEHVLLSKEQYKQALSLFADVGELNVAITLLDEYFEQMPDMANKFTNHYVSLKRFSKNIIDAQNTKAKQKGNYNYNNSTKDTYTKPTYEKFIEDDVPKLSLDEIKSLLDDPFGLSVDDEKYEGINITEEDASEVLTNLFVKESSKEKYVGENQETELITIATPELNDVKQFSFERATRTEDIHNIPPALFNVVENLYLGFFGGLINREDFDEKLETFEKKYDYKLSGDEKRILFSHAIDAYKW